MKKEYARVQWGNRFIPVEHVHEIGGSSKRPEMMIPHKLYDLPAFRLTPFLPPPFPEIRVGACQECGLVVFAAPGNG